MSPFLLFDLHPNIGNPIRIKRVSLKMKTVEELKEVVESVIKDKNLFLVDLTLSKSNVIEIFIDSLEGVDINACICVSRDVEDKLNRDEEDFELTVSSAGIGYPFKVPQQYQKNIGKTVEVKLDDNNKLTGVLKSFNGEEIVVECEEKKMVEGKKRKESVQTEKTIRLNHIKQIKDVIIF